MRKLMLMLVVLVFVGSVFAAPAEPYRLAFITSTNIGVPWDCSVNLDEADAHVQNLADLAGIGNDGFYGDLDNWKVIASTSYVDARDHTETNPFEDGAGVPIYLVDGTTMVASGNVELWSGLIANVIGQDQDGNAKTHWPHTGTYLDGTVCNPDDPDYESYGRGFDNPDSIGQGNGAATDQWIWRVSTQRPATEQLPIYAISEIIPEPATMCLLGLGGLAMLRRRR